MSAPIEIAINALLCDSNPNNLRKMGYTRPISKESLRTHLKDIFQNYQFVESFHTVESSSEYESIKEVIKHHLSLTDFSIWIAPTKGIVDWNDGDISILTIWCPNGHFANWVFQNFNDKIKQALSDEMGGGPFSIVKL